MRNTSAKKLPRVFSSVSATAEYCHASINIVVISVSTVGILYEAAKIPFASSPHILFTRNCPETLVTHQKIVVGIIGTLYFSISRAMAGSNSDSFMSLYSLCHTTIKSVTMTFAITTDSTYPVTPMRNTTRKSMLKAILSAVLIIPCTANTVVFPSARI